MSFRDMDHQQKGLQKRNIKEYMSFSDVHIILHYAYHQKLCISLHNMHAHIILKTENRDRKRDVKTDKYLLILLSVFPFIKVICILGSISSLGGEGPNQVKVIFILT